MGTKGHPSIYLLAAVFAAVCFSASAAKAAAPAYTVPECRLADAVVPKVTAKNGRETLSSLFNDKPTWLQFMACVQTGKPSWIDAAVALLAFSDAGASEELDSSLGEALGNNPKKVLERTPSSLDFICSGPDVDDPRFDSYILSMAEIERRQKALLKVNGSALAPMARDCQLKLENAKAGIAHFYQVTSTPPK